MKTLFLLGGSGDIGKSIAYKFNKNKYHIIAPTKNELSLEDMGSINEYFKNKQPDIDVLIQSAGWNQPKKIEETTIADINKTNAINVLGFYRVVQHFIPMFKKRKNGHILAISSLYGFLAREKRISYVMSKHALNGLIKTLSLELGRFNIQVNTLSPGFVDTKMTRKNNTPYTIRKIAEKTALGRLAKPDEIANVAYFLCSHENTYITGHDVIADGGYSVGGFQK